MSNDSEEIVVSKKNWFLFFIILSSFVVLILFLNKNFHSISLQNDIGVIIYYGFFIVWISHYLAFNKHFLQNIKYLFYFFLIFIFLIIGFTYRDELILIKKKVVAAILPGKLLQVNSKTLQFEMSEDGHFYINASVNGKPILFLVDTGASDIVLTPRDAKQLEYDINKIKEFRMYETANGKVMGYLANINEIRVGQFFIKNLQISINKEPMTTSLLGMSFFRHLKEFKFIKDKLLISWDS